MHKPTQIPDKLYFKIGEVARLINVEPHVLRFWETEFTEITPSKSKAKQRLYRREDVETILLIRDLLYEKKFTIEGAKNHLREIKQYLKDSKKQQQFTFGFATEPVSHSDSEKTTSAPVQKSEHNFPDIQKVIKDMEKFLQEKI